jgi:hypothetical protein
LKIQNILKGEVVTDPGDLEARLGLSMNDNAMINAGYKFQTAAEGSHAGIQLAMAMIMLKMSRIDQFTLVEFIRRLAFQDACDNSPVPLPNGIKDLKALHMKMRKWIDQGWEMETDLTNMSRPDFVEYMEFRITQSVLKDVREAQASVKQELIDNLPEEARKELESE